MQPMSTQVRDYFKTITEVRDCKTEHMTEIKTRHKALAAL